MKLLDKWTNEWPPRDWRSMVALIASIGGGAIAFVLAWRVMTFIANQEDWRKGLAVVDQLKVVLAQLSALRAMAVGILVIMGCSMLGLWFVLGKRSFELELWKIKMKAGGGEDSVPPPPPAPGVSVTTTVTPAPSTAIEVSDTPTSSEGAAKD